MCRKKGLALTLSLVLHLGLLLLVGSLLPHSAGESRIFQVYLATGASGSVGGPPAPQPQAEPQHLPVTTTSEPTASAASSLAVSSDQPAAKISQADQQLPPPEPLPSFQAVVHISPAISKTIPKPAAAKTNAVAQAALSPAESTTAQSDAERGAKKENADAGGGRTTAGPSTPSASLAGTSRQGYGKNYLAMVFAKIEAAKRYPRLAIRRRMEGSTEVVFRLDEKGGLLAVDLAGSSGYHSLDQAALAAVNRAAPFPPLPAGGRAPPHTLKVTISFILSLKE